MNFKGPDPVARIRARERVTEVAEIVQQEAEIAELPQRSRSQLTIKEEEWKQKERHVENPRESYTLTPILLSSHF
ncbi:hypothetical protein F2Q69_00054485 [Brassica cretica]|uniref:Uncharacterized protein n=1 Tax=Brassica cretica TaxID=69181 RepID=A0A8S9MT74_BRACR|nr:hypothetical protein F2Q69_00054485 [Brassica cretica]